MPVRKVVRPTGRGVRGQFPSRKMGRMISWESTLERDAIIYLEMSPAIVRYEEQPANIYYDDDGLTRRYVPDFEAVLTSGEVVHIEVKPSHKLLEPELAAKYDKIRKHYAGTGIRFCFLTEKEVRVEPFLSNLEKLMKHRPRNGDEDLNSHLQSLSLLPAKTIGGAAAVCGGELPVYQLIAAGHLKCDLTQPLSASTLIRPNGEEDDDAELCL